MVDGISAVDIATVILDVEPTPREVPEDDWQPHREPGLVQLVAGAVIDVATRPAAALDAARPAATDVRATAARVASVTGGGLSQARLMARQAPDTPLNAA